MLLSPNSVLSGPVRTRTAYLFIANEAFYQVNYGPWYPGSQPTKNFSCYGEVSYIQHSHENSRDYMRKPPIECTDSDRMKFDMNSFSLNFSEDY